MPQSQFKIVWNLIIIVILLYFSTYVPFRIAFVEEEEPLGLKIWDYFVDAIFFIDIFVNFFSAVELADGKVETRLNVIACMYLRGYLLIDLVATVPLNGFE
mmetsp:Transcript_7565/g.9901  ORF Transcript_7565/g.9901 Transcript_7565/m.9901 type:complete len:101 (-) Transcript_7565:128-430(-)